MTLQNITVPAAGEPIDLMFMTTLAEYIADINNTMLASRKAVSSLYTFPGRTGIETEDVAIWTGVAGPYIVENAAAPSNISWGLNYSAEINFMAQPVVTATPIVTTDGDPIMCWIHKTSISGTSGYFRFLEKARRRESVQIHVMAIGPGRVK